ncbi:MAG: hypothetical protein H6757_05030 [Candidatus Omnitrophica bacterium]|nr:hypothetical protein [Candidatus Omnitrophota bacterium]
MERLNRAKSAVSRAWINVPLAKDAQTVNVYSNAIQQMKNLVTVNVLLVMLAAMIMTAVS